MESLLGGSAVTQEMKWRLLPGEEGQEMLHGGRDSWFGCAEQGTSPLAGLSFGATEKSSDSRNVCGIHDRE